MRAVLRELELEAMTNRDAETLRQAVVVLRRVSTKPKGFWLAVLCKVLSDKADRLDEATVR